MPLRISYHVTKKAVALCKHVERNGKDKDAEFGLYSDQEPSSLDDPILRRNKFPLLLPAPPPPKFKSSTASVQVASMCLCIPAIKSLSS